LIQHLVATSIRELRSLVSHVEQLRIYVQSLTIASFGGW